MIGLLTKCEDRVRGMRTLPSSLEKFYPAKYKLLCYNNLKIEDLSNTFEGFISFPRNTWDLPGWINIKLAQEKNIVFFDSNPSSKWHTIRRSYSNGYFFARDYNMSWWWSFLSEKNIDINLKSSSLKGEVFTIAYYARAEHNQQKLNSVVIDLLNQYEFKYKNIIFYGFGQEEEFRKIIKEYNKKYSDNKTKFVFNTDTDYIFKHLINGEYWVADLKGDAIPNAYFEAKHLGIKTKTINTEKSATGIKEIDYLLERPNIKQELIFMKKHFGLILDAQFRSALFDSQKNHALKFPIPSKKSLNVSWDETLDLIKDHNG